MQTGPAIQQQPQQVDARAKSQTPKPGDPAKPQSDVSSSRATSPAASPSSLGGHSIVAKRATSPKAPKAFSSVSKGNSPTSSRASSPLAGSRPTSPVANGQKVNNNNGNKRKADDSASGGPSVTNGQPKAKKRKEVPPVTPEEMQTMLIDWLKNAKGEPTTRECIQHFTPYLTDQAKKQEFSKLVRRVATLQGTTLVLRSSAASAAPSPAAMAQ